MRVYRSGLGAALLFAIIAVSAVVAAPPNFDSLRARAAAEHRLILIGILDSRAIESRLVRDRCFGDPRAKPIIKDHYVVYMLERGEDPALEAQYAVTRYPTVILQSASGAEIDRLSGGFFPNIFLKVLDAAAAGTSDIQELKATALKPGTGVSAHLALARAYNSRGLRQEALEELIWCEKDGPVVDAKGYRASNGIILLQIKSLAAYLPDAEAFLKELQESMASRLNLDNPDSIDLAFQQYTALQLGDESLKLFDRLPPKSPLRQKHFGSVFSEMVNQRRYRDAVQQTDLETFINLFYPAYGFLGDEETAERDVPAKEAQIRQDLAARRKAYIGEVSAAAVEALLGVGQLEKAKRLAGRAIEDLGNRDLVMNLEHAASRADTPTAVLFAKWLKDANPAPPPGATKK